MFTFGHGVRAWCCNAFIARVDVYPGYNVGDKGELK